MAKICFKGSLHPDDDCGNVPSQQKLGVEEALAACVIEFMIFF